MILHKYVHIMLLKPLQACRMEHNNYKRVTEQSLTSVVVQGLYLPAGKQEHRVVIAAEVSQ